jgi:lipopolysaccharide transport system ATP-binding protein
MDDIALSVTGVSKAYPRYARPSDRLKALLLPGRYHPELFWALRDVSFDVRRGQTVGVVGRNGAGKSTLLQIVARTLMPTSGTVAVRGRVSALLELGSGFNPEFTGRENVLFQGSIMGLRRREIEARFDAIAAFADIGDFIDEPVRTYSSGMFVRLAFAVAIGMEPDILVVDEALSVGDALFQRKCFSKIRSIQEHGGTIIFVSHSGGTVVELCDRAFLLDRGELLTSGAPRDVIASYHRLLFAPPESQERIRAEFSRGPTPGPLERPVEAPRRSEHLDPALTTAPFVYASRGAEIEGVGLLNGSGQAVNVLVQGTEYEYVYRVTFRQAGFQIRFGMMIKTVSGLELGGAVSHAAGGGLDHVDADDVVDVRFRFRCLLQPATYFLNAGVVAVVDGEEVFLHRKVDALAFRVEPNPGRLATGIVDFLVEPRITVVPRAARRALGETP